MKGILARNANIDLGLAILASTSEPPHTSRTIAAYCGCSRQRIQQIEQKALRKLRAAFYRDRILKEAFENGFEHYRRNQLRERIERAPHRGDNVGNWLFARELGIGKESGANRA
jgi:hypothetical protein